MKTLFQLINQIKFLLTHSNIVKFLNNKNCHCNKFYLKGLPPALVLSLSPETPPDIIEKIFTTIVRSIVHQKENHLETVESLIARVLSVYKINIDGTDIKNAICYGIDKGSLAAVDLTQELYDFVGETAILYADKLTVSSPTSSAHSSVQSSPRSSGSSSSGSSLNKEPSELSELVSSIGNYISEHKLLVIGSVAAVAIVGTIVYILWKRRGPTPPTGEELTTSTKSGQNSNSTAVTCNEVTCKIASKFIHSFSFLSLSLLSIFFSTHLLILPYINYAL
jgi:hypothetical protein